MGLTPFDVQNLNNSIAGIGNAFADRRKEDMQQQHLDIEEELRQKQLDTEMRRSQAEQDRATTMQTGQDLRDKQSLLQSIMGLNAGGQLSGDSLDQVNNFLKTDPHFGKIGLQLVKPPQKPDPNVGQSAVAQTLKQAEAFRANGNPHYADILEKAAENYGKPPLTEAQRNMEAADAEEQTADKMQAGELETDPLLEAQIARHKQNADFLRRGGRPAPVDPTQFEEVETKPNPVDPTQTLTTVKRKLAAGQAPAGNVTAAPADPKQRVTGQKYSTPKGVMRWTGTGWLQ